MNALYLQLYLAVLIYIILNGVANVKRLFRLYILRLTALTECNTVEHRVGFVVNKLKLYMLLLAAYDLACSIVAHIICAEHRLLVIGAVRCEFLEVVEEATAYLVEVYFGINID